MKAIPNKWKVKSSKEVRDYYTKQFGDDIYDIENVFFKSHNLDGVPIWAEGPKNKSFLSFKNPNDEYPTITNEQFKCFVSGETQGNVSKSNFKMRNTVNLVKVVFKTRDVKINAVERELTVSVGVNEKGDLYGGYAVRNSKDEVSDFEIGKKVSFGRALNDRTNLLKGQGVSYPTMCNKHVLRGVSDFLFSQIISGKITIKGVK